jgi:predicted aldo/keto reductase-like oxidoreductase
MYLSCLIPESSILSIIMTKQNLGRRKFIRNSSLGILGAGMAGKAKLTNPLANTADGERAKIQQYRILGRTGFEVSDLSTGAPRNETILRAFLDAGANFIDAGETYMNGNTEKLIGRVLKDYDRKKFFINAKVYSEEKKFKSKEDVIERVRKTLERIESDYVDCCMIHEITKKEDAQEENYHAAMEVLKAEGRVRSTGVTCHGNAHLVTPEETIDKVLMSVVEDGRFDVIQMAYNFMNAPMSEPVLDACAEKNIGTVIIKSNPVMIYEGLNRAVTRMEERGDTIPEITQIFYDKYKEQNAYAKEFFKDYQAEDNDKLIDAAQLFVLSNPKAHCTILALNTVQDVDRYLSLSGKKLDDAHALVLDQYKNTFGYLNCRIGCNACEQSCPHKIPVSTIMRYNYYYQNKREEKHAMQLYDKLHNYRADVCQSCPGYCEDACPFGVAAKRLMAVAHDNLSFDAPNLA